jgi:DNA replication protein DnaC
LLQAKQDLKLSQLIKKLDRYEVLLIDDISYIPFERSETDVLFQLLSERYEMRSTLITSNVPFAKWPSLFKDEMTTAAVIDRLVHHATILELNAESYRITQAKQKHNAKEGSLVIKNFDKSCKEPIYKVKCDS